MTIRGDSYPDTGGNHLSRLVGATIAFGVKEACKALRAVYEAKVLQEKDAVISQFGSSENSPG